MDKKQFAARFQSAVDLTVANTKLLCFNTISSQYKFIVSPNDSKSQVVLDETEVAYIKTLKHLHKKPLLFNEVLDLIQVGDRNPLWINISVYEAGEDITLIELVCARRLRKVEDTPNNLDKFPPFHVWIPAPTKRTRKKDTNKFDVNWRSVEDKNLKQGFIGILKSFFNK